MRRWTPHRSSKLALFLGLALSLSASALTGCGHSAGELAAKVGGSNKKPDGQPCAKDAECMNVCLTASEAEKTSNLQPNTCGKADRVSVN